MSKQILEDIARKIRALRRAWVFAPHPDDEILGTGGIIAKYPNNFFVFCVTDGGGSKCRVGNDENERNNVTLQRKEYDILSQTVLGNLDSLYLGHREVKSDIGRSAFRSDIETLISVGKPKIIFLPSPYENPVEVETHRRVTETLVDVLRELRHRTGFSLARVYGYEVWDEIPKGPGIVIENVSGELPLVKSAMEVHRTEQSVKNFADLKEARARVVAITARNSPDEFRFGEKFLDMTSLVYEGVSLDYFCKSRDPREYKSFPAKIPYNPIGEMLKKTLEVKNGD